MNSKEEDYHYDRRTRKTKPVVGMRALLRFLWDPSYALSVAVVLWIGELIFNLLIVRFVAYTEIDWKAYMEEVAGVLEEGNYDYTQLEGGTGPLVYPAGFVWIYSVLYFLTNKGTNILLAQYLFVGLYMACLAIVMSIYIRTKCPPWLLFLLCLSKRIHSIFALRLFNDCFAMFFLYIAVYLFTHHRWLIGCIIYSVALSVKMNILLFAPPLALLLVKSVGVLRALCYAFLCLILQVLVALPFLQVNAWGYLARSFNFGRQFLFVWSVNWQFLQEETFLGGTWALSLLALHLTVLLLFLFLKWCKEEGGPLRVVWKGFDSSMLSTTKLLDAEHIVLLLFTGNFIGIVCARSLHYQFYVWYFHTIPFLLHHAEYPRHLKVILFCCIEALWNVYPSTPTSSACLLFCHVVLLLGLFLAPIPSPFSSSASSAASNNKHHNKIL
ncbi:dolichyl-P-Man:Man(5)GlcNAc(2)-PP-dolichol alpha-1,3-mannosyltransferase [Balamuthia mandrillaris]